MPTAVVVIPTKNEEASIVSVIDEARSAFDGLGYDRLHLLVVDDSVDRTREFAEAVGAHVINGGGEGLGTAMFRGLKEALAFEPDVIVSIDGDGQTDAKAEIAEFIKVIEERKGDLVLGSRFQREGLVGYDYRLINRLGTRILTYILRRRTGLQLTDSHGGIRAMTPAVVKELQIIGNHTYVQEAIIDAVEKGFRVVELPSVWRKRRHGTSRVVGSIRKYVFYTLPILLLRTGHHVRSLYNVGLGLIVLAFVYFSYIFAAEGFTFVLGHRTPALVLIALMVTTGIQLFFFGFIIQLLAQVKRATDQILYQHPQPPVVQPDRGHETSTAGDEAHG